MKRARAAAKIYNFLPERCGHVEYPQIIKILSLVQVYQSRSCNQNSTHTKGGKATPRGQPPALLPRFPGQNMN